MNLLGSVCYDPAAAVSKGTTQLQAMTAFDTTNLRVTATVPSHGKVRVRMACNVTGGTTNPAILLGVLNTTNIVGRVAPLFFPGTNSSTTQLATAVAEFIASGLAAGSTNFDAAWAVQQVVAATNIRYGGPNNTTAATAWGGFCFEIWDPQPNPPNFGSLSIDANGRTDHIKMAGTTQTGRDLGLSVLLAADQAVNATKLGGTTQTGRDIGASVLLAADQAVNATKIGGTTQTGRDIGLSVLLAADQAVNMTKVSGTTQTARDLGAQLDAAISTRMASYTQPAGFLAATFPAGTIASTTNLTAGTIAAVSGAVGSVTGAVGSVTGNVGGNVTGSVGSVVGLTASNLDAAVSSRLATSGYTAPDNTSITAVKAKTDSLTFTKANELDANIKSVFGTTITGSGTTAAPWNP